MKTIITTTTTMAIAMAMVLTVAPNAFASHSSDANACENDGLYDGKNNPFSQEMLDMCGDIYTDAFIRGCMSIDDNSRDDCETATDSD
jgi:hypothetical protein